MKKGIMNNGYLKEDGGACSVSVDAHYTIRHKNRPLASTPRPTGDSVELETQKLNYSSCSIGLEKTI